VINILSPGFTTPNGAAFLHPLLKHRRSLTDVGLKIRITADLERASRDCDVLGIDSKMFKDQWEDGGDRVLEYLNSARESVDALFWFDTTDSTGSLQHAVFPFVDLYFKSQLLQDRKQYARPHYGDRIFTDFYHREFGVEDDEVSPDRALDSEPAINKLRVSWNSGLSTYSLLGPWLIGLYRRLPLPFLLSFPGNWTSPLSKRSNDVSVRFGTTHDRATVRYQRECIRNILKHRIDTEKLGRRAYLGELARSKLTVSPFGWGEITLKDFEVFLTGGALVKPSMDHLETWPNWYDPSVTYVKHKWDLTDLEDQLEAILEDDEARLRISQSAQERYRHYLVGPEAGEEFARHVKTLVANGTL
jgi:hypothetical protein